ncbi:hypothetical protein SAMN04488563_2805 [Jiangella alkaliphila]|uniref:F0F1-ATPase subunit Ca2+/Mg2+ transporter n=1 Tax=Jiangella alkaliphila TaxID=419479 RepID=A0A1H2JKD5_9ACTN|nr:hypothetical protein SAMN04488563_2805 [Jiangella alkaliphila]
MSPDDPDDVRQTDQNGAWDAFALVASGVAVWGGVGWLVSEWLNSRVFLVLGLLVGMGAALYLVWVRYGKP